MTYPQVFSRPVLSVILMAGIATLARPAAADIALSDNLALSGDLRAGYFNLRREERNGSSDTRDNWRGRMRLGLRWQVDSHWTLATRFAGRYASDQSGHGFSLDWSAPSPSGLTNGRSTIDEAYAAYRREDWSLTVGRFQSQQGLMGVAKKSLGRSDSPSTDISWTDGLQWQFPLADGWQAKLLAEYNDRQGPSNSKRAPLDFTATRARWSGFVALENPRPWGPVVQREVSFHYLPDALDRHGLGYATSDYRALMATTALRWPIGAQGQAFVLGLEAGHAMDKPRQGSLALLPGYGNSDGNAWQVSFNLMDMAPGHSVGLVGARAGGGWLLSPDFIPNSQMVEVRYQWLIDSHQRFEARLRYREDIDKPVSAVRERQDTDFYLRYTYKF